MDAHLLLGKLHYACGQYSEGINSFKRADLQNLSEKKLPLYVFKLLNHKSWPKTVFRRSLKIVAESYAVKGLCLQKEPAATSKYKKAEREEEMSKCFNLASDLALLYMQKLEKEQSSVISVTGTHSPQPPPLQKTLGILLEQALQEAPALLLRRGKAAEALERYRGTLCAVETQGANAIRLKLMCQMAELLLQGLSREEYVAPLNTTPKASIWKPKQYALLNQVRLGRKIMSNLFKKWIIFFSLFQGMSVKKFFWCC